MRSNFPFITVVKLLGILIPSLAVAVEKKWDGSTSDPDPATGGAVAWFSTNANRWSPDGFPGVNDHLLMDDSLISLPSSMSVSGTRTVQSVTINSASVGTLRTNVSGTAAQELGLNGGGGVNPVLLELRNAANGALSVGANGVLTIVANTSGQFSVASNNTLTLTSHALISASTRTIEKSGGGTLLLQRSDNTASATVISGGTLALGSTGSITGSISIKTGANFNVSAIASGFTVASTRALSGTGSVTGKTIVQGTLSPGSNIGSLSVGNQDWIGGGEYVWEVNSLPSGTAGSNWDLLNVNGTLDVFTGPGTFKLKLISLDGTGANPNTTISGFSSPQSYSWIIASATTAITNFNAAKFTFDTTQFSASASGNWSIEQSGNNLLLVYSTPEPSAAGLLIVPLMLLRRRRERRSKVQTIKKY